MNQFKVRMWVDSRPTEIVVGASTSATALVIAKKMYPMSRVVSAKKI